MARLRLENDQVRELTRLCQEHLVLGADPEARLVALLAGLRRVLGKSFDAWLRRAEARSANKLPALGLSRRRQETLELLVAGATEKEAATQMGLSVHTIHEYAQHIYRVLGVSSRAELVRHVLSSGEGGLRK